MSSNNLVLLLRPFPNPRPSFQSLSITLNYPPPLPECTNRVQNPTPEICAYLGVKGMLMFFFPPRFDEWLLIILILNDSPNDDRCRRVTTDGNQAPTLNPRSPQSAWVLYFVVRPPLSMKSSVFAFGMKLSLVCVTVQVRWKVSVKVGSVFRAQKFIRW